MTIIENVFKKMTNRKNLHQNTLTRKCIFEYEKIETFLRD